MTTGKNLFPKIVNYLKRPEKISSELNVENNCFYIDNVTLFTLYV